MSDPEGLSESKGGEVKNKESDSAQGSGDMSSKEVTETTTSTAAKGDNTNSKEEEESSTQHGTLEQKEDNQGKDDALIENENDEARPGDEVTAQKEKNEEEVEEEVEEKEKEKEKERESEEKGEGGGDDFDNTKEVANNSTKGKSVPSLEFIASFLQKGERVYVRLMYDVHKKTYAVDIDGDDNIYEMTEITSSKGVPIVPGDLHLNRTVSILGRICTLRQCSGTTKNWLESNAKILLKMQDDIYDELRKYKILPAIPRNSKVLTQVPIDSLRKHIKEMLEELRKLRPKKAAKFRIPPALGE